MMTSPFQLSTSHSSVEIFKQHDRTEFTFRNSYVILELVISTLIFWTELNCWRISFSNKGMLLLGWSHPYKSSMAVTMNWLIVMEYPFPKWNRIFFLSHSFVFPLSRTWQWATRRVSYKWQALLTHPENLSAPHDFVGVHVAHPCFLVFLVCWMFVCVFVLIRILSASLDIRFVWLILRFSYLFFFKIGVIDTFSHM